MSRLILIVKVSRLLYWALRFQVFRWFDFIRDYLKIERSGLFDKEFYRKSLAIEDANRLDFLAHYLARGAKEGKGSHPLFDTAYYLNKYPDVAAARMNALTHYLTYGTKDGRNPIPLFDTAYYLMMNQEIDKTQLHPLVHYYQRGAWEKRNPHPLFQSDYYLMKNPNVAASGVNPLVHYMEFGAREGRNPHPLFDTAYYLKKYPDIAASGINPLVHYIEFGAWEGRNPHPLFDTAYYLKKYSDVAASGINPLVHYLTFGAKDRRNPIPLFDTAYYLMKNPEIAETHLPPLIHYLESGAWEKRNPHPFFQSDYYLRKNPDVAASGINPLVHYIEFGAREGKKPNPMFDASYYLKKNPEATASDVNPLSHYIEDGSIRGINPSPLFDMNYYVCTYPDILESGINPLIHYLEVGMREGRQPNNAYKIWLEQHGLTNDDRKRILSEISILSYQPLFSIIVPVFNTDERWLRKCFDSVLSQLYPHWELCITDDASTMPHVRRVLEEYVSKDPRIRVVFREENGHISACSNTALAMVRGEYIALLDHDDELSVDALYENAVLLNHYSDADMIYSDEDKISEKGERFDPFFKPDWSPDTFLSQMYTCHLGIYRTKLIKNIGGFREGFEGSQDYDLVLRLMENTQKIHHIPKILYHWRTIPGSTALAADSKHYAHKAGLKALEDAMSRRNERGWVEDAQRYRGHFITHYTLADHPLPLISILIPTRDNADCLDVCLDSIFSKSTHPHFEILVLDNGSVEQKTKMTFARWERKEPSKIRVIPLDMPFNYSRLNNLGSKQARGDLLLLLNDDVTVITSGWLQEMAGQALRPNVGAVGAHLLYPDETIQHAGIVLGVGGIANYSHFLARADSPGYFGWLLSVANYSAVTGACLMVKKDLYLSMGGLDETLAVSYNDVDFCLRLLSKGYFNVTLPQVRLYHIESKSRGKDDVDEKRKRFQNETDTMLKRWENLIRRDPFYNPNLTRDNEDFSIKLEPIDS